MARHAAADHRAIEHVERCEQRGRAVALVVVRHGAGAALLHRQARLAAVECLDLALLVDRQHQGLVGRVEVKADDIHHLGGEVRIAGQLEAFDQMRLQLVRPPDPLHRGNADADRFGEHARTPMGRGRGPFMQRHIDDPLNHPRRQRRRPGWSCLVPQQPIDPVLEVPITPAADHRLRRANAALDFLRRDPIGQQQHDPRPHGVLLRRIPVGHQSLQPTTVRRDKRDCWVSSHPDKNLTSEPKCESSVWGTTLASLRFRRSPIAT